MDNDSGYASLDVILYDDGQNFTFDRYVNTLVSNLFMINELNKMDLYDKINLVVYSLSTTILNESLGSYITTLNSSLNLSIVVSDKGYTGIVQLLNACTGDDVLFIRIGDTLDSISKPYSASEIGSKGGVGITDTDKYIDILNFSGLFCDRLQLSNLLNKINYTEYFTTDMAMLSVLTFRDYLYKHLKQYKLMDRPSNVKRHHIASISNFYEHLITNVYPKLLHSDQGNLVKAVIDNELGKSRWERDDNM